MGVDLTQLAYAQNSYRASLLLPPPGVGNLWLCSSLPHPRDLKKPPGLSQYRQSKSQVTTNCSAYGKQVKNTHIKGKHTQTKQSERREIVINRSEYSCIQFNRSTAKITLYSMSKQGMHNN